jgi:hypothetical protein
MTSRKELAEGIVQKDSDQILKNSFEEKRYRMIDQVSNDPKEHSLRFTSTATFFENYRSMLRGCADTGAQKTFFG